VAGVSPAPWRAGNRARTNHPSASPPHGSGGRAPKGLRARAVSWSIGACEHHEPVTAHFIIATSTVKWFTGWKFTGNFTAVDLIAASTNALRPTADGDGGADRGSLVHRRLRGRCRTRLFYCVFVGWLLVLTGISRDCGGRRLGNKKCPAGIGRTTPCCRQRAVAHGEFDRVCVLGPRRPDDSGG